MTDQPCKNSTKVVTFDMSNPATVQKFLENCSLVMALLFEIYEGPNALEFLCGHVDILRAGDCFHHLVDNDIRIVNDHTNLPPQKCPYCGYDFDYCTGLQPEAKPKVGDVSLCLRCMEVGIYGDGMIVRKITPPELVQLRASSAWETIEKAHNASRMMNRRLLS